MAIEPSCSCESSNSLMMRILAIADLDSYPPDGDAGTDCIQQADVLLSCGDIVDSVILGIAADCGCSKVFAVKGNHDGRGAFPPPIVDLHLHTETHQGVVFGGFNGSWKYKPRGHFLYEQHEADRLLASFPRVDVFVAHNAPRGIHDKEDDVHYGFGAFNAYIRRHHPRLFVHGHQHVDGETELDGTRVVGVFGPRFLELETAGGC